MRSGKDLILATKPFAVDSPARSWCYALSTALLLGASTVGTIENFHLAGRIVCSVLSGLLLLRLFVIFHDQQHDAILSGSRLAEGFMRVVGILALSPSSVWRSSHDYHHRHNSKLRTAHIGSFPIMTRNEYAQSPRAARVKYRFMRHPLTILFGYVFVFQYGMCIYPFFNKPREHADCIVAFLLHVAIAVALTWWLGWPALLLTLVVPHLIGSALGAYLFYAQHNFPGASFHDRAGWAYEKAALESSSFMKTGAVMAWFTANIGYHHIHHLNARIPFYRLPQVLKEVPELRTPKTTSLHPAEILRCLRIKVWDTDAQKMVGLSSRGRGEGRFGG